MTLIDPKALREAQEQQKKIQQQYLNSLPVVVWFKFWYPKDPDRHDNEIWILAKDLDEAEACLYEKVGLVNIIEYEERVCRVHDITTPLARKFYKMWKPKFETERQSEKDRGIFSRRFEKGE